MAGQEPCQVFIQCYLSPLGNIDTVQKRFRKLLPNLFQLTYSTTTRTAEK